MTEGDRPWLWIIGGPNGAGKTTLAMKTLGTLLPRVFLNADEIAKGIAPTNPESVAVQAGRLLLTRLNELRSSRTAFVLESTLSGASYLRLIDEMRADGWRIGLLYVWVDTAELSLARVADRVRKGGHRVPDADVQRRHHRSRRLMRDYLAASDRAIIFDNSGEVPVRVAETRSGKLVIHRPSSAIVEFLR